MRLVCLGKNEKIGTVLLLGIKLLHAGSREETEKSVILMKGCFARAGQQARLSGGLHHNIGWKVNERPTYTYAHTQTHNHTDRHKHTRGPELSQSK